MAPPVVVCLPRWRIVVTVLINLLLTGGGIYLLVRQRSVFDLVVGGVVLALFGPNLPYWTGRLRKDVRVLTITDDGLEAPDVGVVSWSEIQALTIGEHLDLKSLRGEVQISLRHLNLTPKALRDEIAVRSGGSWQFGQWSSRAS